MTGKLAKTRVYRIRPSADGSVQAAWAWRCDACGIIGFGCAHEQIHQMGTWRAQLCGAFQHVHLEHPRPVDPSRLQHSTMFGRMRCSTTRPTPAQVAMFYRVLETGGAYGAADLSNDDECREAMHFALEALCFDGPQDGAR